jgi:hypothetical protein
MNSAHACQESKNGEHANKAPSNAAFKTTAHTSCCLVRLFLAAVFVIRVLLRRGVGLLCFCTAKVASIRPRGLVVISGILPQRSSFIYSHNYLRGGIHLTQAQCIFNRHIISWFENPAQESTEIPVEHPSSS